MRLAKLLLIYSLPLAAQEFRANITGLVNDPTGARGAGAKVLLKDLDRNVTIGTETNESGRYLTGFLPRAVTRWRWRKLASSAACGKISGCKRRTG